MIAPLLPWPRLSTAARALSPEDVEAQYLLAVDSYVILEAKERTKHAATVMWRGYEGALLFWIGELARQRPPELLPGSMYADAWVRAYRRSEMPVGPLPWWLGNERFHLRCQSVLIAEDPAHYAHQFWNAPLDLAYLWPTNKENEWWMP